MYHRSTMQANQGLSGPFRIHSVPAKPFRCSCYSPVKNRCQMTDQPQAEIPSRSRTHGSNGQFPNGVSGNPKGRPPGPSRQQSLIRRMLDEADDMLSAQIAKAKEGDTAAAQLLFSRILPVLRSQSEKVCFELDPTLPLSQQTEAVLIAMSAGHVAPDVGKQIIDAITALGNVRAVEELEKRIVNLEAKQVR